MEKPLLSILIGANVDSEQQFVCSSWLLLPTTNDKIEQAIKMASLSGKKGTYKIITSNSNCSLIPDSDEDIYELNKKIIHIGDLASAEEVEALNELFNGNMYELMEIIDKGDYEFIPDKTFADLLEENKDNDIQNKEDLLRKGYNELSTGILKINWWAEEQIKTDYKSYRRRNLKLL